MYLFLVTEFDCAKKSTLMNKNNPEKERLQKTIRNSKYLDVTAKISKL